MKKQVLAFVTVSALCITLIHPGHTFAGQKENIDKQLAQIQQQADAAAKKRQEAQKLASSLTAKKEMEAVSMQELQQSINDQGKKLNELNGQINDVTIKLQDTSDQLDQAEVRVSERDKQLRSRLRLMYMNGSVSYLDVILSSTSFTDFLDRFQMLRTIVGQDKAILEANKTDRDLIADKKRQAEQQLTEVKDLYAKAETVKDSLTKQEKQKEVVIASLAKEADHAEQIGEDQEQSLVELAKQKSILYQKKQAILQEERRQAELARQRALKKKTAQPQKLTASGVYSGGRVGWPVPSSSVISSTFGYRLDPIAHVNKLHKGIDISAPVGSTIVAAEDGIVLIAGWVNGYGNTVVLDHGNGMWTWYGHIREGGIKVAEGTAVKKGQKIAEVGSTGDSTGNHLHFEVRINEQPTNPLPYLR